MFATVWPGFHKFSQVIILYDIYIFHKALLLVFFKENNLIIFHYEPESAYLYYCHHSPLAPICFAEGKGYLLVPGAGNTVGLLEVGSSQTRHRKVEEVGLRIEAALPQIWRQLLADLLKSRSNFIVLIIFYIYIFSSVLKTLSTTWSQILAIFTQFFFCCISVDLIFKKEIRYSFHNV